MAIREPWRGLMWGRCVRSTTPAATHLQPGYGGPANGARTPPTFDVTVTGLPAHFRTERWVVRFGSRRDATYRGPLEASATDPRTDFGADEGSARKIPVGSHEPSNHDFRPRAGTRPDGTHSSRIAIHRSPPDARGGRSFVFRALRTGVGDAVRSGEDKGRENGGRPPPFPGRGSVT